MALIIGDNFSYQGKKYLDNRQEFSSVEEMKNYPSTSLPKVFYAFVGTTEYKYSVDNEFDELTGKWRVWTGGSKDEIQISDAVPSDSSVKLWVKSNEDEEAGDLLADKIIDEFTTIIQDMLARMKSLETKIAYLEKIIADGDIVKPDNKPDTNTNSIKMKIEDNSTLKIEDDSILIFEKNI